MRIQIFDSTLHDGTRADGVFFGVEDKLLIAHRLDEFGVDYIDGGWPAVDQRDQEFFDRARGLALAHAKLVAFGTVAPLHRDALVAAGTPAVCLAGESWDLHVYKTLATDAETHLTHIRESVTFFKRLGREVIYNAEHFFDAWEANPEFAMSTLRAAHESGADVLCLCDSNGGTLTSRLAEICTEMRETFPTASLGIHARNDADLAVANTMIAVEKGFDHVQGCINGYGERCGCANLCSVIPNLELKAGHRTVGREKLEQLSSLSRFIAEIANLGLSPSQPYVGVNAFAHDMPAWMEDDHTRPEYVGNAARTGDLSFKVSTHPLAKRLTAEGRRILLDSIRQKEQEGYDLAGADGSFELLLRETLAPNARFFNVLSYQVTTRGNAGSEAQTSAEVTLEVNDAVLSATASGRGPVHALDLAVRQCLLTIYPAVGKVRLSDYKLRMLDPHKGSAAKARALAEWTDGTRSWTTAGVSDNIVEASWLALTSAVQLELLRLHADTTRPTPTEDYSWAV